MHNFANDKFSSMGMNRRQTLREKITRIPTVKARQPTDLRLYDLQNIYIILSCDGNKKPQKIPFSSNNKEEMM